MLGRRFALLLLFVPAAAFAVPRPLVLWLHGCGQTAASFAAQTGIASLAKREDFAVLTPEQSPWAHPLRCWRWFTEPGDGPRLRDLVETTLRRNPELDPRRVYVAGFSAGAAMAHALAVRYPEVFAAAFVHSGLGFAFAENRWEVPWAMRFGALRGRRFSSARALLADTGRTRVTPTLVVHGDRDVIVAPTNGVQILQQLEDIGSCSSKLVEVPGLEHQWAAGATTLAWNFFQEYENVSGSF